ncbi:MAG: oxidoreductase [Bacteroidia bacterium]
MKTALVVGATGAVGRALVYQLIEDKNYMRILVLSRKPLTIKHHKLSVVMVNFDTLADYSEQMAADDVFCCLGTTIKVAGSKAAFYKIDHDYVIDIARICKQKGAQQFILVTAMGADVNSAIFYNKVKGEVEQHIADLRYDTFITVRPSLLLTNRSEFRFGEWIAQVMMKYTGFLFVGPLKKIKAIPVETVAKAMRHYANKNLKGNHVFTNDTLFVE